MAKPTKPVPPGKSGAPGKPAALVKPGAPSKSAAAAKPLTVREFQELIERIYGERDSARGTAGTFMWFAEEVGELSRALRRGQRGQLEAEFADVFAWLATLASIHGVDLGRAALAKYGQGCPRCSATPCHCGDPHAGHGEPAARP